MPYMSFTLDTSHFERSPLNASASLNIPYMAVACDTSHFEMSPLKDVESANMLDMSVMEETSHSSIGPCGPLGQASTDGGGKFRLGLRFTVGDKVQECAHACTRRIDDHCKCEYSGWEGRAVNVFATYTRRRL